MKLFITWRKKKETTNETQIEFKRDSKIKIKFIEFLTKIKSNQKVALASVLTLSLIAFSLCTVSYFVLADNDVFYASDFVNDPDLGYANVLFEYGEYPQTKANDTLTSLINTNGYVHDSETVTYNPNVSKDPNGDRYLRTGSSPDYTYYKYEPIKWRILSIDKTNDEVFAVAENVLGIQKWATTSEKAWTSSLSSLESWLNWDFSNVAFSSSSGFSNSALKSKQYETGVSEELTLLSYDDITGTMGVKYGFSSVADSYETNDSTNIKTEKTNRLGILTDYALSQNPTHVTRQISLSDSPNNGKKTINWWTRTIADTRSPYYGSYGGGVYANESFTYKNGVRPAATFYLSEIKDSIISIDARPRKQNASDTKRLAGFVYDDGAMTMEVPSGLTVDDADKLEVIFDDGSVYYITYDGNGATSGVSYVQAVNKSNAGNDIIDVPSSRFSKKANVELKTNGVGEDKHLEGDANVINYNSMPDGSGTTYELTGTVPSNPVDTTLYAQWGGSDEITLPDAQTTDESGEFLGWFNLAEGGHLIGGAGDTITPDGDLILYAHFENINPDIFYASDLVNDSSMGYLNVTFEYGEYPQSKVTDTSGFPTSPVDGQEYEISSGSKAGRYRFRSYNGKSGWFKYEPIKWRILSIDKTNGEVFVLSENILDFMAWDISGSDNFWSDNPPIRRFLNGDFYNKAFLNTQGKPISKNYWNSADTATSCDGTDAIDKVTLLSSLDLGNYEAGVERGTRFGFVSNRNNYESTNLEPVDRVYEIYSENTNRLALLTDYSSLNSDFKGKITIPGSVNNGKVSGYWWTKTRYNPTSNSYLVCTYRGNSEGYDKEHVDGVRPAATFKVSDIEDLQLTISNTNVHSSDYEFGGYTFIQDEIINLSDLYSRVSSCGGITLKNLPYVKAHFGEGTFEGNIRVYSSPSTRIIDNDGTITQVDDPTIYSDFINNMLSSIKPGFDVSEYLRENGDIKLDGNHDIALGYETVYLSICNQLQVFMFTNDSGVTSGKLTLDDSYYWKDHEWLEDNDGNKLYELHYGLMEFNVNSGITLTYSYQGDLAGTEHTVYKVPGTESEYYIDDISNGTWDEDEYRYVVIRPKYKIENCTVNFDANTGRGKMKSQTIKFEDNDKLNANKFKKGVEVSFKGNGGSLGLFDDSKSAKYKFAGWNTEPDGSGTSYENGAKLNLSSEDGIYDITLYAQWDTASDDVELPTPSRSGYDFDGWYTSPDGGTKIGEGGETFTPLSDTVLYAHWFKSGTSNVANPDIFYASDFVNNPEYGYLNTTFEYGVYPQRAITDSSITSGLDNYHPDENGFISAAGMPIKIFKDSSGNYYYCDPIKWRILSIDDISGEVLAIAENVLDCQPWDDQILNDNKWSDNPTIRQWLNDDFLNKAFTKDEQEAIIQKFYTLGESNLDGDLTSDKVTLLSIDELSGDKGVKFGFARDPLATEDVDNTDPNAVKVLSEYTNRNATGSDFAINKYASWLTRPILQKDGSINDGKIIINWWTKSRKDSDETRAVFGDSSLNERQSDTLLGVRPVVTFNFDEIKSNSAFIDSCDVHGSEYTNLWNDDYGPSFNNKYYSPSDIDTLIYTNMINVGNVRLFKTNFALNPYYPVYKVYTSPSTSGFHGDGTRYHFDNPEDVLLEKVNDYLHWEEIPEGLAEACPPESDKFNLLIGTLFYDSAVIHSYQVEGNVVKADLTLKDDYEWEGHPLAKDADGKTIYEVYSLYNDNLTKLGEVAGPNHTIYFCEDMYSHFDDPTSDIKFDHQADTSLIIRPKWNPTECIVHFDANGGSGSMEDEEINTLNGGTLSKNKFTNGYTVLFKTNGGEIASNKKKLTAGPVFAGWNTEPDGSGTDYTDEDFFQPSNDFELTLYAKWGTSTNVTLPTTTMDGATFDGWYTEKSGGTKIGDAGDPYSPVSNTTLYAHWIKTGTTETVEPEIFYASDLTTNPEYGYVNATFEYGEYPSKLMSDSELAADDNYLAYALDAKFTTDDYEISTSPLGYIFSITNKDDESKIDKYFYGADSKIYKYEPIKWRVLSIDYTNGEVFALAENVLDATTWDSTSADQKWSSNPPIRQFVNDTFYNRAFSDEEKENIITKVYPLYDDGMEGTEINDKVTLLAYEEVSDWGDPISFKYGFSDYKLIGNNYSWSCDQYNNSTKIVTTEYTNRNTTPTDYAAARGDFEFTFSISGSPNNGKIFADWWLRSRYDDSDACECGVYGPGWNVPNNLYGVRPAITFDFDAVKNLPVTIDRTSVHGPQYKKFMLASEQYFYFKTTTCSTMTLSNINSLLTVNGLSLNLQNLRTLQAIFYRGSSAVPVTILQSIPTKFLGLDGLWNSYSSPEFIAEQLNSNLTQINEEFGTSYTDIRDFLRDQGMINRVAHDDYMVTPEVPLYLFGSNRIDVCLSTFDDGTVSTNFKLEDKYRWDGRVWKEDEDGNKYYELHIMTDVEYEPGKHQDSYEYKGDLIGSEQVICNVPGTTQFYFESLPDVIWDDNKNVPVIRPKFLPNSCTITFDANGGSGTMPDQEIPFNSSEELNTNNFTYGTVIKFKGNGGLVNGKDEDESGITFTGWNTNSDGSGTGFADGAIYSPETGEFETKLYAMWGSEISLPTAVKEGATFDGWYNLADGGVRVGGAGDTYPYSSAMTLYAHFTDNKTHKESKPDIFYASDLTNDPEHGYANAVFEYGEYPQSLVTDTTGFPTSPIDGQEYEIQSGSKAGKYRFRTNGTNSGWFKYEPIKWRILSIDFTNGEVFALSENILDFMAWDDSSSDKFWSDNPPIRQFLNGDFYDKAFANTEGKPIEKNYWNPYVSTDGCEGSPVVDKVTLLSDLDLGDIPDYEPRGTKYGFISNSNEYETYTNPVDEIYEISTEKTNRLAFVTDYSSLITNFKGRVMVDGSVNNGKISSNWWTKTWFSTSNNQSIMLCTYRGNSEGCIKTIINGIRPAVTFKLDDVKKIPFQITNAGVHVTDGSYMFAGFVHDRGSMEYQYENIDSVNSFFNGNETAQREVYINLIKNWKAYIVPGTYIPTVSDIQFIYVPISTKICNRYTGEWMQYDSPEELTTEAYSSFLEGHTLKELIEAANQEGNYYDSFSHYDFEFVTGKPFLYQTFVGTLKAPMFSNYNDGTNDVVAADLILDDSYYWKDRTWAEDSNGNKIYELHFMQAEVKNGVPKYKYTYQGDLVGTNHKIYKVHNTELDIDECYVDSTSNGLFSLNYALLDNFEDGDYNLGIIIRPKYLPVEYKVHYDANGGSGTMDDQTISYEDGGVLKDNEFVAQGVSVTFKPNGGTISDADRVKSASMIFDKWNTKPDGTGTSYSAGTDPNIDPNTLIRDLDLYAIWKANNAGITLPQVTKSGYTFTGWYTKPEGGEKVAESGTYSTNCDITLYAHWKKNGTNKEFKPRVFYAEDLVNNPEYGYVNATFEYGMYPTNIIPNFNSVNPANGSIILNYIENNPDKVISNNEIVEVAPEIYAHVYVFDYQDENPNLDRGTYYALLQINPNNQMDKALNALVKVEPIKWRVLSVDLTNGEVYAIAENVVDINQFDDGNDSYASSTLQKWLNDDFLNSAFNDEEKENIVSKKYSDVSEKVTLLGYDDVFGTNNKYGFRSIEEDIENVTVGTDDGKLITTSYSNISSPLYMWGLLNETSSYNYYLKMNQNGEAISFQNWWLRDNDSNDVSKAYSASEVGTSESSLKTSKKGVRPVVTFDFDAIKDLDFDASVANGRDDGFKKEYTYMDCYRHSDTIAGLKSELRLVKNSNQAGALSLLDGFKLYNLNNLKVYFYKGEIDGYKDEIFISPFNSWNDIFTGEHFEFRNPEDFYNDVFKDDFEDEFGITYEEYGPFSEETWVDLYFRYQRACFEDNFADFIGAILINEDGTISGDLNLPGEESYIWDGRVWDEDANGNKLYEVWYLTLEPGEGEDDEEKYENIIPTWKLGGYISGSKHKLFKEEDPSGNNRYYIDDKNANGSWLEFDYGDYNSDAYTDLTTYVSENRDVIIRPKFLPNSFRIKLEDWDSSNPGTEYIYVDKDHTGFFFDSNCTMPITSSDSITPPSEEGYIFEGYFDYDATINYITKEGKLTNNLDPSDFDEQDIWLWADWTPIDYNITYLGLDGATNNPDNPSTYNADSDEITIKAPTKLGYTFTGWTGTDLDGSQMEFTIPSGSIHDRTYTANWTIDTYNITYHLDSDETVSDPNPATYTVEDTFKLNNPVKEHYEFTGWTGANGASEEIEVTVSKGTTGDLDFYPHFTPAKHKVTFNSNGGSSVSDKEVEYQTALGDLSIPTKKDALFAGWFKEATYQNRAASTDLITDNITLYALWYEVSPINDETYSAVQIKPSLTVTDSKGNTITIPNSDVTVSYGENVNAGEGSVTLTGFGNSVTIKFKINKRTISSSDIQIDPSLKEIVKYKNGTVNQKTNVEVSPFVKLASCNSEEVILNVSESFISDSSGNPVTRPTRKEKTSSYDCIKLSGLSVSNSNYQLEPGLSSKIFENFTQLVDNEVPKLEEILVLNTKKMKKTDTLNVSVRFSEELNASSADLDTLKQNFKVTYDLGTDFLGEELTLDSISISNSKTIFNFKGTIKSDLEDEKEFALSNFNFIQVQGSDLEDVCGNKLDMDQTGIILPSGYYVSTKKEQPTPSGGGGGGGGAGPVYTILPVDDSIKANKSYMNGYEDETFKPSNPVSREEVAAIVARLNGEFDEQINFTSFNDFEDALDRWSKNYIGFCRYKDLFHGYEDGSFHPTANMTRAELAVLVSNFLRVQNTDFTGVDLTKSAFSDVDGRWYEESVNKLAHLGILNGYEDGTFKGDNPVTRIEVAIVMNKINKKVVPDDKTYKKVKKEIVKKFRDIKEGTWYFDDVVMATMDYETILTQNANNVSKK